MTLFKSFSTATLACLISLVSVANPSCPDDSVPTCAAAGQTTPICAQASTDEENSAEENTVPPVSTCRSEDQVAECEMLNGTPVAVCVGPPTCSNGNTATCASEQQKVPTCGQASTDEENSTAVIPAATCKAPREAECKMHNGVPKAKCVVPVVTAPPAP